MIAWARLNILITLIVITLGALTRLLDSGLGCPDWPGCYGHVLPPENIEDIQQANQDHPLFPVDQIKAWSEMIHRFAAAILGFSLLLLTATSLTFPKYKPHLTINVIALVWVILQGVFGMLTVTLRIWPPVVTLHLLAGLIMLAIIYWQLKSFEFEKQSIQYFSSLNITKTYRLPLIFVFILTFLQIALGGWTSAQYAGLSCPDLPLCQGQIWPETVHGPFYAPMMSAQEYLGGLLPMADRMAIQILHRLNACFLTIAVLYFCYRLISKKHTQLALILIIPLIIQVLIGIGNVFLLLPLPLALLHNSGAVLFWLCLWFVYFSLIEKEERVYE